MKSKSFLVVSLLIVASMVLSACGGAGGSGDSASGPLQSVGEGEGAVSIVAWAGYIERGEIKPILAATYRLEELRDAQRAFIAKQHTGNIVVTP